MLEKFLLCTLFLYNIVFLPIRYQHIHIIVITAVERQFQQELFGNWGDSAGLMKLAVLRLNAATVSHEVCEMYATTWPAIALSWSRSGGTRSLHILTYSVRWRLPGNALRNTAIVLHPLHAHLADSAPGRSRMRIDTDVNNSTCRCRSDLKQEPLARGNYHGSVRCEIDLMRNEDPIA